MRGASCNAAQRPPLTSSWPSTKMAELVLGGMKMDHPKSQTRQSGFPESGQQFYSRELIRQVISDSTASKFRRLGSSSARVSSDGLLPCWATNAWAVGASADDVPALSSLGGVVLTMDTTTESASSPPCGFWRIDDQQLEIYPCVVSFVVYDIQKGNNDEIKFYMGYN
jgi:hypothetical protein